MSNLNPKDNSKVIVDHLAFSFPLASLKDICTRSGTTRDRSYRWTKMPKFSHYTKNTQPQEYDAILQKFNADYYDSLFLRLEVFAFVVLGLKVGASREKGFNGYKNSHRLTDKSGRVELGFLGIGGNNNTVYFQISGEGCKHLFSHTSFFILHHWLSNILEITHLTRIDLAYDDFDGNFDCDYAINAYHDGAFQGFNGGPMPHMVPSPEYRGREIVGYIVRVGKRSSNTFWRIYDKAAEQKLLGQTWYRSEVELKRVKITALLNPAGAFAGINSFSSSLNAAVGFSVRSSIRRATLDMAARIRWAKQQCGRTLSDIVESFDGDIFAAFGAVIDHRGGKFVLPDTQKQLLFDQLRNS
jgi:phage replication initiation protein